MSHHRGIIFILLRNIQHLFHHALFEVDGILHVKFHSSFFSDLFNIVELEDLPPIVSIKDQEQFDKIDSVMSDLQDVKPGFYPSGRRHYVRGTKNLQPVQISNELNIAKRTMLKDIVAKTWLKVRRIFIE